MKCVIRAPKCWCLDDAFLAKLPIVSGRDPNPILRPSLKSVADLTFDILSGGKVTYVACATITELIEKSDSTDWLLFFTKSGHREHLFHQLRVAVLADWLFDIVIDRKLLAKLDKSKVRACLWTAALLHDHSYALPAFARAIPMMFSEWTSSVSDSGRKSFDSLCKAYEGLSSYNIMRDLRSLLAQENSRDSLRTQVINGQVMDMVEGWAWDYLGEQCAKLDDALICQLLYHVNADRYDHGLWSGINLAAKLTEKGMPWAERPQEANFVRKMIDAIVIHSGKHFKGQVFSVSRNPIAGVLALADEIQEWKRVIMASNDKPLDIACDVAMELLKGREIHISFTYSQADLKGAGWTLESLAGPKKTAIERLNGAKGLPHFSVTVDDRMTCFAKHTGEPRAKPRLFPPAVQLRRQ